MNREPIYAALFAVVAGVPGLVTASRRCRHWTDVAPAEQPALFQVQRAEKIERRTGLPPKHTLAVDLYLYANTGSDPLLAPASILNPLIDAIEAALLPNDAGGTPQTLSGLVTHAWIDGPIETDEGVLGAQAVAILPISILVP
jgi:hypothetical protein